MINKRFNIPKDYVIEYDRNKNYNQKNNPNYLPPYRSEDFKSIYDGLQVEMHIVDHCNLNCNCCNHFSPLAEPWFIELEDFKEQITLLKNNISSLKTFLFIGGEPALHPQLFELCKAAREILGNEIKIGVISNGTIIKKIAEHKQDYLDLNIYFTFSSYMNKTKLDEIEQLKPLGKVFNTRILSKSTIVEPCGSLDGFDNFFNCIDHKLPCFTLKNKKLYICPFSAHLEHYCKKANITIPEIEWVDYLPVDKINNDLDLIQKFCFTPKAICNYCSQDEDAYPYVDSYKDLAEYTWPLKQLYFRDYERYEKIINGGMNGTFNWAINKDLNPGRVDKVFESWSFEKEMLRYGHGKIDIIIPYYNETVKQLVQLKENLLTQSIINDCVIYLISDCGNMDWRVIDLFQRTPNLHCVFLRNPIHSGPGATRNVGLKNSFNENILFLDADDLFIEETALEQLYNKINENKLLVRFGIFGEENDGKNGYIFKRELIQKYNISFKNIFFGEDIEFYINLATKVPTDKFFNYQNKTNIFIGYNLTKGNNITSTFVSYDNLHFSYFTSGFIGLMSVLKQEELIQSEEMIHYSVTRYFSFILRLLDENHNFIYQNTFMRALIYFILKELLYYRPNYINNKDLQTILDLFNIDVNDNNDIIIKDFLINYISDNYINHEKLKVNAEYILNYLKG